MVSKKTKLAEKLFGTKPKVTNKIVAEELGVGVAGTAQYMKPLGFMPKWMDKTDATGQQYQVKVWVQ